MIISPQLYTVYAKDVVSSAGVKQSVRLTPKLWTHAFEPSNLSVSGSAPGKMDIEDFLNFGGFAPAVSGTQILPSSTVPSVDGWGVHINTTTTAGSIKPMSTEVDGAVRLTLGATDNHTALMQASGSAGSQFGVSDTAGNASNKRTIFETRIRLGQIGNNFGMFAGIALPGMNAATGTLLADAGGFAQVDYLGFAVNEANGDELTFVWGATGQAGVVGYTYATALAASTWYNLGFSFDPEAPPAKRIAIWIDGVEQGTYVTSTNMAAATFPNGVLMSCCVGLKNAAAVAKTLDVDHISFYQAG